MLMDTTITIFSDVGYDTSVKFPGTHHKIKNSQETG